MGFNEELINFSHAEITFNQPLKKFTTLGVGGSAKYFAYTDSLYGLNNLLALAKKHKIKYKVIGNGSNLLVSEKGFDGLIINLKKLNDVFFKRDCVRAMAGANIEKLLTFNLNHNLSGLEYLSGIPATVGGAIVMNASAFGHNISERIETVEVLKNGKIKVYDKNECNFKYRSSRFLKSKETVVSATFSFLEGKREDVCNLMKNTLAKRKDSQPFGRSCGSIFKNPKNCFAGELIEKAGLKGEKIGGATVSLKHANFIITDAKATATDVYQLINLIKTKVSKKFNVNLVEEVELVGDF